VRSRVRHRGPGAKGRLLRRRAMRLSVPSTRDAITCLRAAVSFARRPLRRARNRSNWDAG
jgi:hypothetical protein